MLRFAFSIVRLRPLRSFAFRDQIEAALLRRSGFPVLPARQPDHPLVHAALREETTIQPDRQSLELERGRPCRTRFPGCRVLWTLPLPPAKNARLIRKSCRGYRSAPTSERRPTQRPADVRWASAAL